MLHCSDSQRREQTILARCRTPGQPWRKTSLSVSLGWLEGGEQKAEYPVPRGRRAGTTRQKNRKHPKRKYKKSAHRVPRTQASYKADRPSIRKQLQQSTRIQKLHAKHPTYSLTRTPDSKKKGAPKRPKRRSLPGAPTPCRFRSGTPTRRETRCPDLRALLLQSRAGRSAYPQSCTQLQKPHPSRRWSARSLSAESRRRP